MVKPVLLGFSALLFLSFASLAQAKSASTMHICGMLEDMQYQADQWADLAADGKCDSGHAKRLTAFSHKHVDNADNGKCSDSSDMSNCIFYSCGWEACAEYSCR